MKKNISIALIVLTVFFSSFVYVSDLDASPRSCGAGLVACIGASDTASDMYGCVKGFLSCMEW